MKLCYRDDVKELGFEDKQEHVICEEQFMVLEAFAVGELRRREREARPENAAASSFISTKDFIFGFRECC